MRRIGLKSLILIGVLLSCLVLAGSEGVFDIRRVLALQLGVLWMIGLLASIMGLAISYFLRSHRESSHHLGFGPYDTRPPASQLLFEARAYALWMGPRDETPAWEFNRPVYVFTISFALLLAGFSMLENRSLMLLKHFHHNMSKDYGQVCPEEGAAQEEAELKPKPEKYGCDLVKKAFALGYTKDLGDCADDPKEKTDEICTHRQWDEPSSHYSYRLIEKFALGLWDSISGLHQSLSPESIAKSTKKLPELSKHHAEGFKGEARSSIHVFTDLREPGGTKEQLRRSLHPNHCQDELRELRFSLAEKGRDRSSQLEDAIAHLLFNPAVAKGAEYCRLYTIHWAAAPSTCEDIVAFGPRVLASLGVNEPVTAVLERQRLEKQFPPPEPKKKAADGKAEAEEVASAPPAPPTPERARISFHCLMTREITPSRSEVKLDGQTFAVSSELLPSVDAQGLMPSQPLMAAVARAFIPGFSYTNLDRKLPFTMSEERFQTEIAKSGDHLRLAKFELLKMSDILAGDQWVASYPEYMEVYPWQTHLSNFVQKFRRAMKREDESK